MGRNYIYEAARVRVMESFLLSEEDEKRLLDAKSETELIQLLKNRGFGNQEMKSVKRLLNEEKNKLQILSKELSGSPLVYRVLCLTEVYEQLKLKLKQSYCNPTERTVKGFISESLQRQLPFWTSKMETAALEAMSLLLQTGNAQLFDMVLDQAALQELYDTARKTRIYALEKYAGQTVAVTDIRIAVRGAAMKKTESFLMEAMAECRQIDIHSLAVWAGKGIKELCIYLEEHGWQEAVEAWKQSPGAFDRWCENSVLDVLEKEKNQAGSFGTVLFYLIRREQEMKKVRVIANNLLRNQ